MSDTSTSNTDITTSQHPDLLNHVNSVVNYINTETSKHSELLSIVTGLKNQLNSFHISLSASDTTILKEAAEDVKKFASALEGDASKVKAWFKQ